jgi:hypothetical protein
MNAPVMAGTAAVGTAAADAGCMRALQPKRPAAAH